MADAVRRARPPKHDDTRAIDLAREFNADFCEVLELTDERRAIRFYDGNHSWDEAERLGIEDVRDILTARDRSRRPR